MDKLTAQRTAPIKPSGHISRKQRKRIKKLLRKAARYRDEVDRKQNALQCQVCGIVGIMAEPIVYDAVVNDTYGTASKLLKRLGLKVR